MQVIVLEAEYTETYLGSKTTTTTEHKDILGVFQSPKDVELQKKIFLNYVNSDGRLSIVEDIIFTERKLSLNTLYYT